MCKSYFVTKKIFLLYCSLEGPVTWRTQACQKPWITSFFRTLDKIRARGQILSLQPSDNNLFQFLLIKKNSGRSFALPSFNSSKKKILASGREPERIWFLCKPGLLLVFLKNGQTLTFSWFSFKFSYQDNNGIQTDLGELGKDLVVSIFHWPKAVLK